MNDEDNYLQVVSASKNLLKCQKEQNKFSKKLQEMRFDTHSVKSRAAATDRLTGACFSVDKAKDLLHKVLVDAMLCNPKPRDAYDTVMLSHSHGFGHTYTFKYTPPLPKCYE